MQKKDTNALIEWDEAGNPVAVKFDDPYYSKRDGRAETRHVFIEGNNLPVRFSSGDDFVVAELGFGTGLNFASTLEAFQGSAGHLSYVSFEQYPLSREVIQRAFEPWQDLWPLVEPFVASGPSDEGWYECRLGNVTLHLAIGDANEMIGSMPVLADAWFLDGFSPAKNPELWNAALMQAVADNTALDGTVATYTAAGWVRRMLNEAGFSVERIKGFGTKRHMSVGTKLPRELIV